MEKERRNGMNKLSIFLNSLDEINISLSEKQIIQFQKYFDYLLEKNKVMNLTAITDEIEVIYKHFIDSLSLNKFINLSEVNHILDIGTGAGFPGIPLKIAFPNLKLVLLDSLKKRTVFLEEVIEKIELEDVKVIHGRAEEFAKIIEYREQFDLCVSRAVTNLTTLVEYCLPYVKIGKRFVAYKSKNAEEEIKESEKAIQILGGELESVKLFQLPYKEMDRSFIMIKKVKNTPDIYPRKSGKALKKPIR